VDVLRRCIASFLSFLVEKNWLQVPEDRRLVSGQVDLTGHPVRDSSDNLKAVKCEELPRPHQKRSRSKYKLACASASSSAI
jgi:hypothetical protein